MVDYLTGGNWPEQLGVMIGENTGEDGCISGGWNVSYAMPIVELDVVAIENLSNTPVRIDAVQGSISKETELRLAGRQSERNELQTAGAVLLPPKGRLVVPIRLLVTSGLEDIDREASNAAFAKLGANSYTGNTSAYRI